MKFGEKYGDSKGVKEVVGYVYQQGDLNLEYFQANRAQHGTNAHQAIQKIS